MTITIAGDGNCIILQRNDEPLIVEDARPSLSVSCDDLARMAVRMHEESLFFIHRHGIRFDFCRDMNGSGTQMLTIDRPNAWGPPDWRMETVFSPAHDPDYIYEADLLLDGSRDYEPTQNKGTHKFQADNVRVDTSCPDTMRDWMVQVFLARLADLDLLSLPHATLAQWVKSGFNMWVTCQTALCHRSVLPLENLRQHADAGLSLEQLQARMRCSRCGQRGARVRPC